ncbi:MAG: hypothetical protein JO353_12080 [Phycisphaerae bacterium]|nr:hypothetical protein [Phycisphaerae bacterium]
MTQHHTIAWAQSSFIDSFDAGAMISTIPPMSITPDLLAKARDRDRAALIDLLVDRYPCLYRMAYALIGREDVASAAVKVVLRQSVAASRLWNSPSDVDRWFMHHTLLTVRRAGARPGELANDPLIRHVVSNNAYYPAFVQALRALSMQQREAFLLHHGERLDERGLGISMDCSMQAASQHLREATKVLRAYGGAMYSVLTEQVVQTYDHLAPPAEMIAPAIRTDLAHRNLRGWCVRVSVLAAQWAVLGLLGWTVWKIVPMLRW